MVCIIGLLSTTWLCFQPFTGKEEVLQVTALMLNPGSLSIVCIQLGPRKLSVIRSSGCPLFRGFLSYCIEVNGRLSESSVISWVSAVEGCPLNGGSTVV